MSGHNDVHNVLGAALGHVTGEAVVRSNGPAGRAFDRHLVQTAIVNLVTTQAAIAVVRRRFGRRHLAVWIVAGEAIELAVAGHVAGALP